MNGGNIADREHLPLHWIAGLTAARGLIATKLFYAVLVDAICMGFNEARVPVVSEFQYYFQSNRVRYGLVHCHAYFERQATISIIEIYFSRETAG
jgi:hypothetical protein